MTIAKMSLFALLDTGSAVTILNEENWKRIPEDQRPALRAPDRVFKAADGGIISTQGFVTLPIQIQQIKFQPWGSPNGTAPAS